MILTSVGRPANRTSRPQSARRAGGLPNHNWLESLTLLARGSRVLQLVQASNEVIALGAGPSSGAAEAMQRFRPELERWEAEANRLGRPIGSVDDDEHFPHLKFYQQRPHRPDIKSETEDGQPVTCLMGKRTDFDHGRMHLSFSPFNQIVACNDFAALIVFTPRSTKHTDVDINWLVDGRAKDVDVDRMIWIWDVTTKQDKIFTENNQRGINSSRYQPGRLSNLENRADTFNRWYFNQLTG